MWSSMQQKKSAAAWGLRLHQPCAFAPSACMNEERHCGRGHESKDKAQRYCEAKKFNHAAVFIYGN
jgi:hypothetical protein